MRRVHIANIKGPKGDKGDPGGAVVDIEGAGYPLVIRGQNKADTWMQAARWVDPVTGVAPPTAITINALHEAGLPLASGPGGELVIQGRNGVGTWVQATKYLGREGVAIPTPQAARAMAQAGVVVLIQGAPSADLDLAPGEVYLFEDNGELTLAVGS